MTTNTTEKKGDDTSNHKSNIDNLANELKQTAMAAVASLASEHVCSDDYNDNNNIYLKKLAEISYRIADAMLKESSYV